MEVFLSHGYHDIHGRRIGGGALGAAHWGRRIGGGALGAAHWGRRIGGGALGAAH